MNRVHRKQRISGSANGMWESRCLSLSNGILEIDRGRFLSEALHPIAPPGNSTANRGNGWWINTGWKLVSLVITRCLAIHIPPLSRWRGDSIGTQFRARASKEMWESIRRPRKAMGEATCLSLAGLSSQRAPLWKTWANAFGAPPSLRSYPQKRQSREIATVFHARHGI